MKKTLTAADVLRALTQIVVDFQTDCEEKLNALPKESKTERKALLMQKGMYTLCFRLGLWEMKMPLTDEHIAETLRLMQKRLDNPMLPQLFKFDQHIMQWYHSQDKESAELVCPYLHALLQMKFMAESHYKDELSCAKEAGDVKKSFELTVKTGTVCEVLSAWKQWWNNEVGIDVPVEV